MKRTWGKIQHQSSNFEDLAGQLCPNESKQESLRALLILSLVNSVLARDSFSYAFFGAFLGLSTGEELVSNYDLAEYIWQATDSVQTLVIFKICLEQLSQDSNSDIEYALSLIQLAEYFAGEGLANESAP